MSTTSKLVSLAVTQNRGIVVDPEAGVILGVSVITAGEAYPINSEPFVIDGATLEGVANAINSVPNGIKSRVTHPEVSGSDSFNAVVGKIKNARVVGDQVKADFHLGKYVDEPIARRLFGLAAEQPEDAGLSIVIEDGEFIEHDGQLLGRVHSLFAVDWVGTPAANPRGMLSKTKPAMRYLAMNMPTEQQMELLRSFAPDLGDDPTISELTAAIEGLDETQKTAFDALAVAGEGEVEEPAMQEDEELPTEEEEVPMAQLADGDGEDDPVGEAPPAKAAASKGDRGKIALAAEKKRVAEICQLAALSNVKSDVLRKVLEDGTSAEQFRKTLLQKAAKGRKAVSMGVKVGMDRNRDTLRPAISDAICLRAGVSPSERNGWKPHERSNDFRGKRLTQLMRSFYHAIGVPDAYELNDLQCIDLLSERKFKDRYPALAGTQTTAAFTNIQRDAINKSLQAAYLDAEPSWQRWARRVTNPDFKTIYRTKLSEVPDLVSTNEAENLDYVTLSDTQETYTLAEYRNGIRLTRRAMINDDLDAFGRIPMLQGRAAARKEDDVAYAVLTDNGTMNETSRALFNTTEGNLASGSANVGAPTVALLQKAFAAMFGFKGLKDAAHLELRPRFLLVPEDIIATSEQLINSNVDPTKSNATPNPFFNQLEVIPSSRLGANSTTAWYLVADFNTIDTLEVCFLEGEESPVLDTEEDFDTNDMKFKVRHTVAANANDWRGFYKNPGA